MLEKANECFLRKPRQHLLSLFLFLFEVMHWAKYECIEMPSSIKGRDRDILPDCYPTKQ